MPRFKLRRKFRVPRTTPHLAELRAAYPLYQQQPGWWNPTPIERQDFVLVCKYLDYYGDPVYSHILKGELQGASLIYHEVEEFNWYLQNDLDPFGRIERRWTDEEAEAQEYAQSHSLGLMAEHRFLQDRAPADFRLGELIRWNPGSGWKDWDLKIVRQYVSEYGEGLVHAGELEVRQKMKQAVVTWYRSQGFKGDFR